MISPMKLKKHGAFLVNFVVDFADGNMSRWEFDMDYSSEHMKIRYHRGDN